MSTEKNEKNWLAQCKKCRGQCCKYIALEIDKPVNKTDYDNIRVPDAKT
jgi:hypothetical protein